MTERPVNGLKIHVTINSSLVPLFKNTDPDVTEGFENPNDNGCTCCRPEKNEKKLLWLPPAVGKLVRPHAQDTKPRIKIDPKEDDANCTDLLFKTVFIAI